jgi:PAS domain S-box-containing protein
MTIWQLAPPDKAAEQKESTRRIFAGEKVPSFETQRLTRDGRLLDVWLTVTNLVDDTGKITGIAVTERDITDRKRKEKEFESAKSLLDTVLDLSPFAMWISDREGMLIRTNRSLRETLNLTDEQLIGKYNVLNDVNLEMQGVMPMVRAVFKMYTPARFMIPWKASNAGDVDFKGGRDVYIDVSMFPILDNNGELTNVVCQWVDISERKRAEEALSSSEAFLNSVIEVSPESIWVSDSEGTMIRMNQACRELFGVTDEEAVGKYNLFKDNLIEAQGFMPLVEDVFRKGEIVRFTIDYDLPRVEHVKVSGAMHRILDVVISSIKDMSGKVTNAIIQHKDITERKRAVAERTAELSAKTAELERINKIFVDRELRMRELKARIAELERQGKRLQR